MFNLSEEFKKAYNQYLDEAYDNIDAELNSIFVDLEEAQNEVVNGFELLKEYYDLAGAEDLNEDASALDVVNKTLGSMGDITKQLLSLTANDDVRADEKVAYQPIISMQQVESIADMKFPKNIIFFLKQLIVWIKNCVMFFIGRIKNVLVALLTGTTVKEKTTRDDLKLQLERAKKIETVDALPALKGKSSIITGRKIDVENVLTEGFFDFLVQPTAPAQDKPKLVSNQPVVISIDLSKDMMSLKELVQHFYDLFDNAFGSNNENLFDSGDLEIILKLFKSLISEMKTGELRTIDINGNAVEANVIDANRVRNNLIVTQTNINNLKEAYQETSNRIKAVSKIINHKELVMASDMGVDQKWLTASTYYQMIEILNTLEPRLKDAEKLQKKLEKLSKQYEKVQQELKAMQSYFNGLVGNITYTSTYQRKIAELFNASKYMTQVVTLRLAGLSLYIKEMKDIQGVIKLLAHVSDNKKIAKLYK